MWYGKIWQLQRRKIEDQLWLRYYPGCSVNWSTGRLGQAECAAILEPVVMSFDAKPQIEYRLRALLAHVQLSQNRLAPSRQNAQIVYDKYRTRNIFPSFEYHHVNTLLRAIALGPPHSGRWGNASGIWNLVYKYAKGLREDPDNRPQVEQHAATGRLLAEMWTFWLKN